VRTKDQVQYIRAVFDLDCEWEGLPPVYRIFVESELFAEREWRWTEHYTEEILQIKSPPGIVVVTLQVVQPALAKFTMSNHRIEHGRAFWVDDSRIKIPIPEY